jgi:hypothetical protein
MPRVSVKANVKRVLSRSSLGLSLIDLANEVRVLLIRDPARRQPFNGQVVRRRTVEALIELFAPDALLETGTGLGATTVFLASTGLPVYSAEIKRLFFWAARVRLRHSRNASLILGSSPDVLRGVAEHMTVRRPLAYLDAHWWSSLPLQQEIDQLLRWDEVVIVVDDVAVTHDSAYGYDTYDDRPLSLEVLDVPPGVFVAFPAGSAADETGGKRGTLYLGQGVEASAALREMVDRGLIRLA